MRSLLLLSLLLLLLHHVNAVPVISEVADKGSSTVCGGTDWIELFNTATTPVSLAGYMLHDDNGPGDADAFVFPEGYTLQPNEYKVLCCNDDPTTPQFGIGGDDTVTLLDAQRVVVSSVGPLFNKGAYDVSYALFESGYEYTTEPTPGAANVLSPLETPQEKAARLEAQNDLGTQFFGMDDNGYPVSGRMEDVLDLKLTMAEDDFLYTTQNSWHEEYRPFTSGQLLQRSDGAEILSFDSVGRLRPKGQSTLYFSICLGIPSIPFSIDFDDTDSSQTLFGAGRVYLRNKLSDRSYMREWTFHRMLARFGLPHLRTRTVRFYLNEQYMGLYDLMEAPDSEYVFYRNFPDFNFTNHALYKIKTASTSCGKQKHYNAENITDAYSRINETTPYIFERGDHRPDIPVLADPDQCSDGFSNILIAEKKDAVLAYVRNEQDCGKMLVEEGLIDRDLGTKNWDPVMERFINEHLSNSTCEPNCAGSNLANEVDVTNFLKIFAVFSTLMHQDSPLGNGNNYYLAQTGDGRWKLVPYDMDNAAARVGIQICDEDCALRMVHWSITRPTCEALEENQLAGPLLSNPALHDQYLEYVREFVSNVLGDQAFMQEIADHAAAIEQDVTPDAWNTYYSHDYSTELSPTAAQWYEPGFPLLSVLRSRKDDILKQFDALDIDNHTKYQVEANEVCVDWRGDNVTPDSCHNNCQYDGCYEPSWTVTGICDTATGICYHGQLDENCEGIPNGGTYPGIEQREGEAVFCQEMVALSACLPAEVSAADETTPGPTTEEMEVTTADKTTPGPTTEETEATTLEAGATNGGSVATATTETPATADTTKEPLAGEDLLVTSTARRQTSWRNWGYIGASAAILVIRA